MTNIRQQFNDFRSNTPRHVQWLLLGAAFIVVIILLTLLLTHKSKHQDDIEISNINATLQYTPNAVHFGSVMVGEISGEFVELVANRNIFIRNVDVSDKTNFVVDGEDCIGQLIKPCSIYIEYEPKIAMNNQRAELTVNWYIENQEEISHVDKIQITYSAQKKPEPVKEPEPKPEPVVVDVPEIEPDYDDYADEEDFEDIIVENPFESNENEKANVSTLAPEKCSEFAIPGYDSSGRQIGWIKPERGANYFHPFSDKDCSMPTGKYDFTTGVITSLKDGSKIGTDSDHIGYRNIRDRNLHVPNLSAPKTNIARAENGRFDTDAIWADDIEHDESRKFNRTKKNEVDASTLMGSAHKDESVASSMPYDRTFILRQFKPIPATIVSEVRADPSVYGCKGSKCNVDENYSIPVRATVDRNVYSDDGRTIILPTGTLLMGYLAGELPGPYQAFGRMNIKWYQFIRPDGVEFNFDKNQDPYSADAQGRMGVPGHGSTDYIEQLVMPVVTALVPAAVNLIAPITDTVINQIDLDNNTVVQSGTIRSSEMAKQDIINTWNKITQKLVVDAIDNTVPPFSIAAGTRINVFSPVDLIVSCADAKGKKCSVIPYGSNSRRKWNDLKQEVSVNKDDASWRGQVRSFDLSKYCSYDGKKVTVGEDWAASGYDYRTVLAYCESQNYVAINNAKQSAYNKQIQTQSAEKKNEYGVNWTSNEGWTTDFGGDTEAEQKYNTEVLGLEYDNEGNIINPFGKSSKTVDVTTLDEDVLTCEDGLTPDANGCCAGETFTDMGEAGWNCCPDVGGDCFPPITVE